MTDKGPLLMTSWRATGACNARCKYCNVDASGAPTPRELSTKEALHLVDEVNKFGVRWFGIKGGEPLLRKDIFEIVGYAKSLGLNVCLLTNGCFVDGEIYDKLVKNQGLDISQHRRSGRNKRRSERKRFIQESLSSHPKIGKGKNPERLSSGDYIYQL